MPDHNHKIPLETPETPEMIEIPETIEHNHNYVPLYMSAIVFALIVLSYIYCALIGIEVNIYREMGSIGISGLITAACWYISK